MKNRLAQSKNADTAAHGIRGISPPILPQVQIHLRDPF